MSHPLIKNIRELDLRNKKVFIRLDLNAPLTDRTPDGQRAISDDNRIEQAMPTIQYAIEQNAKVILASHLGRPKGKPNPDYSLEPVGRFLAEKYGLEILFADDCVGDGIELTVQNLSPGQIVLLENLRFHRGEEANDKSFVHQLARFTDVYISDAFGTTHRKHASTYGLPETISEKGMGFLIEKELKYLNQLLDTPPRPFYTILGGAKVSDKIKTIESLLPRVDGLLIGGAMAYAFMAASGKKIPSEWKQPSAEDIQSAKKILSMARNKPILLPEDTQQGCDIGPSTIELFKNRLYQARCVFWNGPLGWFEKEEFAVGTYEIAKMLSETSALKIVGGGDTVAAIRKFGLDQKFDHLSTGGGAVLEYLEGKGLPGIDILKSNKNRKSVQSISGERRD